MDKLFLYIMNMSLTASVAIAAVWLTRLVLRRFRAPKIVAYALWAIVLFNLLCPFKPESALSLMPINPAPIPLDIGMQAEPRIDSGVTVINNAVSAVLPAATPAASVTPLQIWTAIGAYLWAAGVIAMLAYALISYVLLKRKVRFATKRGYGFYEDGSVPSPFVLGFIRPRIYLPAGLADADLAYILCHERTHIRRRDYLVKPLAFLALALHWFNPLVWCAYYLLNADMEMSCDERVLREMGGAVKAPYSAALLRLATGRQLVGFSPLAFGEGGVKERVKNVLNFKKPARVIIIAAVALAAVISVGFAVNRAGGRTVYKNHKAAFAALSKYLPGAVTENLPDFREEQTEDGTLWLWSQSDGEGFIHKIEVIENGGVISRYHYNNYYFDLPENPTTIDEAGNLALDFAYDFIAEGALNFEHKPYENNIYDPGAVESWVAESDSGAAQYVIMVNLVYGYVEQFETNAAAGYAFPLRETPQLYTLAEGGAAMFSMPTVTLYEAGTARLSQPMISSLGLFGTGGYTVKGNELTVSQQGAEVVFAISDDGGTLTVKSSTLQYAGAGAVYKYQPSAKKERVAGAPLTLDALRELGKNPQNISLADFEGYERVVIDPDYYMLDAGGAYTVYVLRSTDGDTSCTVERRYDGETFPLHLNGSTGLVFEEFLGEITIPKYKPREWVRTGVTSKTTLPEFPGVTFVWTPDKVTDGTRTLFEGMLVQKVFFADLTNDGKPELCAVRSTGSGLVDVSVVVYDYAAGKIYVLSDRMKYDYDLSMEDGRLMVTQTRWQVDNAYPAVSTELRLINGEISKFGDLPEDESYPFTGITILSTLRTPYVGDASAVGKIVNALPPFDTSLTQRFFYIGDGESPNTLTIYYERDGKGERNITKAPADVALLFALIGNLEKAEFAFRDTIGGAELDKAAYASSIAFSKEQITDYIGTIGLSWRDFQNDWDKSVALLFNRPRTESGGLPKETVPLDMGNVNALDISVSGVSLRFETSADPRAEITSNYLGLADYRVSSTEAGVLSFYGGKTANNLPDAKVVIILYLPQRQYDRLSVAAKAANVDFSGIDAKTLDLDISSSAVFAGGLTNTLADVKSSSSTLTLSYLGGFENDLTVDAKSSTIDIIYAKAIDNAAVMISASASTVNAGALERLRKNDGSASLAYDGTLGRAAHKLWIDARACTLSIESPAMATLIPQR